MFFIPQYHAGAAVVDVLDNGRNLRVFLAQGLDEVVLGREYRGCSDQHHHDLAAGETAANQHMAQQAVAGIFIVSADFERFQHATDGADDLVCFLVFDHAGFDRNDVVGFLFVNAGDGFAFAVAEYSVHLVAVVERIVHAFDTVYFAVVSKKLLHLALFHLKLFCVWHVQILASAAAVRYRAQTFLLRCLFLFC